MGQLRAEPLSGVGWVGLIPPRGRVVAFLRRFLLRQTSHAMMWGHRDWIVPSVFHRVVGNRWDPFVLGSVVVPPHVSVHFLF